MAKNTASPPDGLNHPFYPWDLKLPNYVPNKLNGLALITIASICAMLIAALAWVITGRRKEPFCFLRRLTLCWFMVCALIHTVLEGYFAIYHSTISGHRTLLGEMWKEYSKGDSRYMSSDSCVVCIETVTAVFVGPLAFLTFWAFMKGNNSRYALQMILSLCQVYGCTIYLLTELKEGFLHSQVGHPVYFYFYLLFLNMLWIIIPLILIVDAFGHITACQVVSDFYIDEYNRKVKSNINNSASKKFI